MIYPKCCNNPIFESTGQGTTLMYSPICFDQNGNPVSGGSNIITETIRCLSCGKSYHSRQTELQKYKKEKQEWYETTYNAYGEIPWIVLDYIGEKK